MDHSTASLRNSDDDEEYVMRNVGSVDRVIRLILGLGLISLVFVGPQTPWGWLGVILLVTALVGWCPLHKLMGIRTC